MKLNARNIQQIQGYLRNVAEVDSNDTISNSASQLAVDLEWVKTPFLFHTLTEAEQALVQYAISKREVYVLKDGARHAVNLNRIAA
jgi:hypothetical protein